MAGHQVSQRGRENCRQGKAERPGLVQHGKAMIGEYSEDRARPLPGARGDRQDGKMDKLNCGKFQSYITKKKGGRRILLLFQF